MISCTCAAAEAKNRPAKKDWVCVVLTLWFVQCQLIWEIIFKTKIKTRIQSLCEEML